MTKKILRKLKRFFYPKKVHDWEDKGLILAAKTLMMTEVWRCAKFAGPFWLQAKEFRVYSQFGDDGIIQWLIHHLDLQKGRFIEFGVGNYFESNTHLLLVNNRWDGYVMDGDKKNIYSVRTSCIYWRYRLCAKQHFINRDNIQNLVNASGFKKIELLHIDLDGNDYWILEALDLSTLNPDILILEYNSLFGQERTISIPYDPAFYRSKAHYSGKYFGASLSALSTLSEKKGYYFIGCNSAGNNAYFLAKKYESHVPKTDISAGFQPAGFREARDENGQLTYSDQDQELELIKGLPVINVLTGTHEKL